MRVAHVITRLIVGGAQENTVASVLGLRDTPDFEVSLVSGPTAGSEGSMVPQIEGAGCPVTVIPSLVRSVHPFKDATALMELTRWFRQWRPDIVHTHSGKAGILGRLAARRAGVRVIIHTIHGPSFGSFQGRLANTVFRYAERVAGMVTTHFVSVAHAMTRHYLEAGIGVQGQYSRIVSGFPMQPFLDARNDPAVRRELGLRGTDFVVGKIARLTTLKGHEDLFAAFAELKRRVPSSKLLLIGDGTWRARLEAQLRSMGLRDRVVFMGLVRPDRIPTYVGVMDALVHLSVREGLPRALPQAMAAGKPVVAYDSDGAGEVCLPGKTGFLVPPGCHGAVADFLAQLAESPGLRDRLGEAGRDMVRELFPVERMIDELRALYRQLALPAGLSRPKPRPGLSRR